MRARTSFLLFTTLLVSSWGHAEVRISNIRVAFEQRDGSFFVREMVSLIPEEGEHDTAASLVIPFPRNAQEAFLSEEHDAAGLTVLENGIRVEGRLPEQGRGVAFMYTLPAQNGGVSFEQRFDRTVHLAHIAFVGPSEGVLIEGTGFSAPTVREISSGLPALFVVGRDFEDGLIRVSISGLEKSLMSTLTVVVTSLSFGILLLGLILYLRRRD